MATTIPAGVERTGSARSASATRSGTRAARNSSAAWRSGFAQERAEPLQKKNPCERFLVEASRPRCAAARLPPWWAPDASASASSSRVTRPSLHEAAPRDRGTWLSTFQRGMRSTVKGDVSLGREVRSAAVASDPPHRGRPGRTACSCARLLGAAGHEVIRRQERPRGGCGLAGVSPPDLVLVDINIPDLDGYEVTLRLRGMPALARVPIVAITARANRQTSLAVGRDGFYRKPIDALRFPRTVARFLGGASGDGRRRRGGRLRERSQKIVERLERQGRRAEDANATPRGGRAPASRVLAEHEPRARDAAEPVVGYLRPLARPTSSGRSRRLQRKSLGPDLGSPRSACAR